MFKGSKKITEEDLVTLSQEKISFISMPVPMNKETGVIFPDHKQATKDHVQTLKTQKVLTKEIMNMADVTQDKDHGMEAKEEEDTSFLISQH